MQVTVNIPDEIAAHFRIQGKEPARAVLEAMAIEGCRTEQMSESEIRALLGFETRMQVHAFLKEHGAYLHYSLDDLEQDRKTARKARQHAGG